MVVSLCAAWAAVPLVLLPVAGRDVPDDAEREVRRRGDFVEVVGVDVIRGGGGFGEAMAVPGSDADKWLLTLICKRGCRPCESLKRDFVENEALRAWVDVRSAEKSWAHYQVFFIEDTSQAFRWKKIRVSGFPTLLVQPPRSGKYGNPKTVVLQHTGYDGDAAALSRELSVGIEAYLTKRVRRLRLGAETEASGGELAKPALNWVIDKADGGSPPFDLPDVIDPREPVGPFAPPALPHRRGVSLEELRRAFPDADAEFVLDQFARGGSMEEARAEWNRRHPVFGGGLSLVSVLAHAVGTVFVLLVLLVLVALCVLVVLGLRRAWMGVRAGAPPVKTP